MEGDFCAVWKFHGVMDGVIHKLFRKRAEGSKATVPWEEFIGACLYDGEFGYYARPDKKRVGGEGADFYTSASLKGGIFSELLAESARTLIKKRWGNPEIFRFVEIGAEPGGQLVKNSDVIRLGDEISIPKNAALISNELLDARPFSRFKFTGGKWSKGYVAIEKSGGGFSFGETFGDAEARELDVLEKYFPRAKVEGFRIDVSFDALELFRSICEKKWSGVIVFADYFRSAAELSELPNGTARAYRKHSDFSDLTLYPGDTDITFSPCSDMFKDIAEECGFSDFGEESQESFFVKNAENKIRSIAELPDPMDVRKRELVQIINPAHMGAAFRMISAVRN